MLSCRRSRRRVAGLIAELALPTRFSMGLLLGRISARSGRPLEVLPLPDRGGAGRPHGLWVEAADTDYIFVEPRTSALHRQHIVLHEIGHILVHERSAPQTDRPDFHGLLPDLDPAVVRRLLARTHDSATDATEQEAEEIATLLGGRVLAAPSSRRIPEVAEVLGFRVSS